MICSILEVLVLMFGFASNLGASGSSPAENCRHSTNQQPVRSHGPSHRGISSVQFQSVPCINCFSQLVIFSKKNQAAFEDTAPLLLEQYCRFHIPGTDDGAALRQIRDGAVELIIRKPSSKRENFAHAMESADV